MKGVILIPLILAGCATAPIGLQDAKQSVDSRMEYVYYKGWRKPAGLTENQGNCTVFAVQYQMAAIRNGHKGYINTCMLPDGQRHAVYDSGEWRLDNRMNYVGQIKDSECK